MSDGNGKSSGTIGMKLFLFLAFVAIFFLGYKNYLLKQEVDVCNKLYSIRINDQWRIIFEFDNGGADNVKITDYHK